MLCRWENVLCLNYIRSYSKLIFVLPLTPQSIAVGLLQLNWTYVYYIFIQGRHTFCNFYFSIIQSWNFVIFRLDNMVNHCLLGPQQFPLKSDWKLMLRVIWKYGPYSHGTSAVYCMQCTGCWSQVVTMLHHHSDPDYTYRCCGGATNISNINNKMNTKMIWCWRDCSTCQFTMCNVYWWKHSDEVVRFIYLINWVLHKVSWRPVHPFISAT